MGWARLDDGWHEHPKTVEAGLEAAGLWVMCLTWAHKHRRKSASPGVVPVSVIERFAGRKAARLSRRLADVGYFDDLTDAGWPIHDFDQFLPRYDPEQAAEAGRKGGKSKRNGSKPLDEPLSEPPPGPLDEPLDGCDATHADASASACRNPVPKVLPEEIAAAASRKLTRENDAAAANPDPLQALQAACDAAALRVRWDKLAGQRTEVAELVGRHGVTALVTAARRAYQADDPPRYANAWLPLWAALPVSLPVGSTSWEGTAAVLSSKPEFDAATNGRGLVAARAALAARVAADEPEVTS